ncbi:MAG: PAS domain S-box protein [Armatimonadota bacterium]|jgi:PAS domain S-box-containing protein
MTGRKRILILMAIMAAVAVCVTGTAILLLYQTALAEVQAPFIQAGVVAAVITAIIVLIAALLFHSVSNPMIAQLERHAEELGAEAEERRQAEEALRTERDRLRAIMSGLESAGIGIDVVRDDYRVLFQNSLLTERFGDITGQLCYEQYMGRGEPCDICPMRRAIATGSAARAELTGADGRPYELLSAPLRNPDGSVDRAIEVIRDITERRRAEEALRESEERFRTVFDEGPLGMVLFDLDGTISRVNSAFARMLGYSQEELTGRTAGDVTHPDDLDGSMRRRNQLLSGETDLVQAEKRYVSKSGDTVWAGITASVIRRDAGRPVYGLGMIEDITERRRAEEALRESEERYRLLFENLYDAAFLGDAEAGVILETNRQGEVLLGATRDEIVGMHHLELHPPEDADTYAQIPWKELTGVVEGEVIRKDGGITPVAIGTTTLGGGAPRFVLGVFRDITEQRRAREELLKAARRESISLLAGGIAHDFNNILTGLMGNVSLSKTCAAEDETLAEMLTEAEEACLRARRLTQQLLTFAKGGAPIRAPVSLARLIRDSVGFALRGSSVGCTYRIPEDLWPADADEGQISQAINGLVINADQAMPDGGTVTVRAENVPVGTEASPSLGDGRYVKVSIEDHGVGIAPEHLARIFDPYFTTKQKGSGLGLATAHSVVHRHDGEITVESEVGVGTTFHLYVPAADEPAPVEEGAEEELPVGTGRILLMDDEAAVQHVGARILRRLGYQVALAADGLEAIGLYREAMDGGAPFDAVIMDLTVPGAMGGQDAIRSLLVMDPDVKAIVSSGYSTDPVMADYKQHGFAAVVPKPYNIAELGKAVQGVLVGPGE